MKAAWRNRTALWIALALPLLAGTARASTFTFANFNDSAPNQWNYTAGVLTANTATATFHSFGPPNQILNYNGAVTYDLRATAVGPAVDNGGVISQVLSGEIVFRNGGVVVLDMSFTASLISGISGSNSVGLKGDTLLNGQLINFSADPSVKVGNFIAPYSFSIALTQIPGIGITGSNLTNFVATSSGSFAADDGGGGGIPEPSTLALLSMPALALLRRRTRN
jgi:hypothetical protein